ncbi:indolepyruvate ferredoxin oxidoreductase family protein [Cereibacter azotoformans]|uniref:Indolepyruvate ferredoxin oxidoreductase n=1 Tax=Cereibacter azotoformans TaxID=43057 RepID=A0A2T5JWR2_9RHOB|nr:indolepyruvate ferredoxin oxidoreductase family protein [Cereibacter azotoformans]AXQ93019.1 indolepyruvate ferredoxin oxidoreductase family protein [Cereibacter sphaeroides]MBO4169290.1 indolepyruvate ferredoxin oxidoreductase family protein [Cereibacter azotoformans]PTR14609.1 indolepyruvate ferredoxin oxidoreductase [Cereibacter azotoformans]UIJ31321.1 indolepyruvate ferredoxin oxidoreductase family protein [Cereibacter azotoformans]
MSRQDVKLSDRTDLAKSPVLLNGTQAMVRLMLMQKARDRAAGLNTAGYVTGYRGSPLGAVDLTMARAEKDLRGADILFQPGLNEDLAATAIWGTQQAELRGEGRFDGVFALWYGKGPGVDRTGDVMRHANMAGTSRHGGVLMAMGDDHTGESSTTLHQSDWAMVDAYIPVLSPAGVQEILDYGLYGWALSRFAGVWVGLKTMKDTVEATAVVDGRPDRMNFVLPDFRMPEGGLNIRLVDTPVAQEARMIDHKRFAAEAFSHANRMDRRVWGRRGAKIGFVSAGKSWLDLVHALSLLGIGEAEAERLGITTYKVGQVWPMDFRGFQDWAEGLELIVCVEEKRKLIEVQAKEAIFNDRRGRRIYGWQNDRGEELFPTRFALDPVGIAEKIGAILIEEGRGTDRVKAGLTRLAEARRADNAQDLAARLPYFCSGCPHNSSTRLPEGSRAYAGIGCHYMVQWMDRDTVGFTQMGGEGANWIGEAPFSKRPHVFQNLGDGTYNHSGVQAIRAALAAGTTITYKILFNDAVAMTGGQHNEGDLSADRIVREIQAMGVGHIAVVHDAKEEVDLSRFPGGIEIHERADLMEVQKKFSRIPGVSAIVYIQTCAAEKRRRRKRGTFPDIDRRVFINTDVCEGCGDCGVQSNCVSIVPVETELGRKRAIDQSSCNKDFSCLNGFCPSFVTLEGAQPRKAATAEIDLPHLPEPDLPTIRGTHNLLVTGVGGTGVVTVGAILSMAAHIDGKAAAMMEMAGLAQKGGAVHIHCRIAEQPSDISAIRVAVGEADAVIGGDLVVTAGAKTLGLMATGRTGAVVNSHDIVTGEFTRNTDFRVPSERLQVSLQARLQDRVAFLDATELARALMGDSIYSNMMVFGAAWQKGLIPLSAEAIHRAIELNGAAVARNARAFALGRWAVLHPAEAARILQPEPVKPVDPVDYRAERLVGYQSRRLARRFRALVDRAPPEIREDVARGYYQLLAYKDEYEVARLHLDTMARARAEFDGDFRPTFHLAPPFLAGKGEERPRKRQFGPWMIPAFRLLAALKPLRGTPLDPFGRNPERRLERRLIAQFEADMAEILPALTPETMELGRELARLPLAIRGYGPVKEANAETAAHRRAELLAAIRAGGAPLPMAAE